MKVTCSGSTSTTPRDETRRVRNWAGSSRPGSSIRKSWPTAPSRVRTTLHPSREHVVLMPTRPRVSRTIYLVCAAEGEAAPTTSVVMMMTRRLQRMTSLRIVPVTSITFAFIADRLLRGPSPFHNLRVLLTRRLFSQRSLMRRIEDLEGDNYISSDSDLDGQAHIVLHAEFE